MVCGYGYISVLLIGTLTYRFKHIIRFGVLLGVFAFLVDANLTAQVAIIAHPEIRISDVDRSDLLDMWTRDVRSWRDDTPIILFDLKEKGPVRDTFYSFIGIRPSRMKSIWLKQLYAGEGEPPQALDEQEEVLTRVRETQGAVGFVRKSHVDSSSCPV